MYFDKASLLTQKFNIWATSAMKTTWSSDFDPMKITDVWVSNINGVSRHCVASNDFMLPTLTGPSF